MGLPDLTPADPLVRPWWHAKAACRGVGSGDFFLDVGQSSRPAKAICAGCEVSEPCLAYALDDASLDGIWAGRTPNDRARLRKLRKAA